MCAVLSTHKRLTYSQNCSVGVGAIYTTDGTESHTYVDTYVRASVMHNIVKQLESEAHRSVARWRRFGN